MPSPGTVLSNGQYRILRPLGAGGFGHVYLAQDTRRGQEVAIKELIPGLSDDEKHLRRFQLEAEATRRLAHRHIVRSYDIFREAGSYYIVMEYMTGGSLGRLLQEWGRLEVDQAVRIAIEVCAGLGYAYAQGVVHCDLKPANILFSADGTAKVADFGIAHVSKEVLSQRWQTSAVFMAGALPYMSPEQVEGACKDPRVDVYATGGVLYHALTGRTYLQFEHDDTPGALARNILRIDTEKPDPPSAHRRSIPAWLDRVVLRALARQPERRYASASDLGAELDRRVVESLYRCALVYMEAGQWSQAKGRLEHVQRLVPGYRDVDESLTHAREELDAAKARQTPRRGVGLSLRPVIAAKTDIGRTRPQNEDYVGYYIPPEADELARKGSLYVAADGVGGHGTGEVASRSAVEVVCQEYYSDAIRDIPKSLTCAVQVANKKIYEWARSDPSKATMGTTLVAAVMRGRKVHLANVGDSRAYVISPQGITRITADHSWVEGQVRARLLTPEQARKHPQRNVITRALGLKTSVDVDIFKWDLKEGDIVFLCTDGLTGHVEDREIADLVRRHPPEEAANLLIDLANSRGGSDNIGVVIISASGTDAGEVAERDRPKKGRFLGFLRGDH